MTCHSPSLQDASAYLQGIVNLNSGTEMASALEDVIESAGRALSQLSQSIPDRKAAIDDLKKAAGDIEESVGHNLLLPGRGATLMDDFAGFARQLAADALEEAVARDGKPQAIEQAQESLDDGDAIRAGADFEQAINKYKDALKKAEGA